MLNIPWWGWALIAVGVLIVARMVAIEDRELRMLRSRMEIEARADETGDEIGGRLIAADTRVPEAVAHAAPSKPARKRKPVASAYAKPRSRKKARKAKRGRVRP